MMEVTEEETPPSPPKRSSPPDPVVSKLLMMEEVTEETPPSPPERSSPPDPVVSKLLMMEEVTEEETPRSPPESSSPPDRVVSKLLMMEEVTEEETPPSLPKHSSPPDPVVCNRPPPLIAGCRVPVKLDGTFVDAEILKVDRIVTGNHQYFIHYIEKDESFDQWVEHGSVDVGNALYPSKTEDGKDEYVKWDDMIIESRNRIKKQVKATKPRNIQLIEFNEQQIVPWYFSPYPRIFSKLPCLYLCPYCLYYFAEPSQLINHLLLCPLFGPPGNYHKIYHDEHEELAVFEVDAAVETEYCERLCLLSKLFLKDKEVKKPIKPFCFYIMCEEVKKDDFRIVGYFSRAKDAIINNVSCLLVIPTNQNTGYGKFLIEFSYLLCKAEKKVGSPEKPMSELGTSCYLSYWLYAIIDAFMSKSEHDLDTKNIESGECCETELGLSMSEISKITSITVGDIISTMNHYKIYNEFHDEQEDVDAEMVDEEMVDIDGNEDGINSEKGESVVGEDDDDMESDDNMYEDGSECDTEDDRGFVFTNVMIEKYLEERNDFPHPKPELLKWKPYAEKYGPSESPTSETSPPATSPTSPPATSTTSPPDTSRKNAPNSAEDEDNVVIFKTGW